MPKSKSKKLVKIDHFWHFQWTFVHSKCKCSSLCWQYWMRDFFVIFKQNDHRPILPVLKTLCTEKRTRNSPLGNYCTNEMEVQKGQEQIVKLFFEGFYCCRPSVLLINSSSNAANLSLYVDCNLESSTLLAIIMKRPLAKFWIFRIITLLHC